MSIPKRKTNIKIYPQKENVERRKELLNEIIQNDTFFPDPILHDDLDRGMLDYVLEYFKVVSNGEQIPIIPKILTIQRWGEISSTWEYSDDDRNIKVPFISIVRKPDVQPGTNPSVQRTIPDRKTFYYHSVPTWNGNQKGFEIYKIPQPVAVDITYDVTIITTEIRDLNKFNKIVLEKFSSRQSYTKIKGHYIPIVLNNINDNSNVNNVEGRRFYVQTYNFTMLGLIVDEEEFEVVPGISRSILTTEFIGEKINKNVIQKKIDVNLATFISDGSRLLYSVGETINKLISVTVNGVLQTLNIDYYHIGGTSKITFGTSPTIDSKIVITYTKDKNGEYDIINETFIYDGTSSTFTLTKNIVDVVIITINGVLNENQDLYTFSENTITLNISLSNDDEIIITYIY